jgi:hypothetical protein
MCSEGGKTTTQRAPCAAYRGSDPGPAHSVSDVDGTLCDRILRDPGGGIVGDLIICLPLAPRERAILTQTLYSDRQGDPPARTWAEDVCEWAREIESRAALWQAPREGGTTDEYGRVQYPAGTVSS